jgi:hypothetical protein
MFNSLIWAYNTFTYTRGILGFPPTTYLLEVKANYHLSTITLKSKSETVITYSCQDLGGLCFLLVSVILLVFSPSVDPSWFSFPIPTCLSLSFVVILLDRLVFPCQYARKRSALNSSVSSEGRSLLLLPPSLNLCLPKPKSGQPNPHFHCL